ncbi:MAG TPA: methyl-accepting chemotaxis protein, partial [bacterium]|nr:methyl-accepting chemotaxis protein [bacterium]
MNKNIVWFRTLNAKLGAMVSLMLVVCLVLIARNIYSMRVLQQNIVGITYSAVNRTVLEKIMSLSDKIPYEKSAGRAETGVEIRDLMETVGDRIRELTQGNASIGLVVSNDPEIASNLQRRVGRWNDQIKPLLEGLLSKTPPDISENDLNSLDESLKASIQDNGDAAEKMNQTADGLMGSYQTFQGFVGALILGIFILFLWVAKGVSKRIRSMVTTAERIAGGEMTLEASVQGGDELADLGATFNTMTGNLRALIETERKGKAQLETLFEAIRETVNNLTLSTSQIMAGTTLQASGAMEQASSVSQTVSTVNEVLQTAEQAAERAKVVAESTLRAMEIGKAGRQSVEESIIGMGTVKEQVETIAENIMALAEQAQAIGEIIATVNDMAEQTNLLALNASIEASRAGEHGKGFSVVAGEVKVLADQSKKATAQVRQILGEIQKATNAAVVVTEEGTKSVNAAIKVVHQSGETIRTLS